MTSESRRGIRVQVLGDVTVSQPGVGLVATPRNVRQLIGLLAAVGPAGMHRDMLAAELWPDVIPKSWASSLRNRVTVARKALGADGVLNQDGLFRFGEHVSVDSWDLISQPTIELAGDPRQLEFLDARPFSGIASSRAILEHIDLIEDARIAVVNQVVDSHETLAPRALHSLRKYQRRHPTNPCVARAAIHAHLQADDEGRAMAMLTRLDEAHRQDSTAPAWLHDLRQLVSERQASYTGPSSEPGDRTTGRSPRNALFDRARASDNWSLALEIATEGLPEASQMEGDPERLKLLEAIPIDRLQPDLRFSLALELSRQLLYANREAEAQKAARLANSLAITPNEELLAYITSSIVGEAIDERTPVPLPASFETATTDSISTRSLQVAVMSHLERDSFASADVLRRKFVSLVESSVEPYRRWHLLLLAAMTHFVDGELNAGIAAAHHASEYAGLFNITDAEIALIGQLSTPWLAHACGLAPGPPDYLGEYSASSASTLSQALQAIARCRDGEIAAVDEFMSGFDYNSRLFFTFPIVAMVGPYVMDPIIQAAVVKRLQRRTGTSAIWGTGVCHLGPVDRILALMASPPNSVASHLEAAVVIADRQQTRLWQVITRLDLAALTNDDSRRTEASALATTPELQQLTSEYRSPLAL